MTRLGNHEGLCSNIGIRTPQATRIRTVKLLPVGEHATIVHGHRVRKIGRFPGTGSDNLVLQTAGGCIHTSIFRVCEALIRRPGTGLCLCLCPFLKTYSDRMPLASTAHVIYVEFKWFYCQRSFS